MTAWVPILNDLFFACLATAPEPENFGRAQKLSEYSNTVKRRTNRWSLAFFFSIIDVAGLAAYCITRSTIQL